MKTTGRTAVALLGIALQSGCATGLIDARDRGQICRVSVLGKSGPPTYRTHPLANPAGAATGTAAGAVAGSAAAMFFLPLMVVAAPIGAVAGAVRGAECAAAAAARPNADAEFQLILEGANSDILTRALQEDLNGRALECSKERAGTQGSDTPDTIVEIDSVAIQGDCGFGKQGVSAFVQWRALNAADRRLLGQRTTICIQGSALDFEPWFADKQQARSEIDLLLARTGRHIATELRSPQRLPCISAPATPDEPEQK